MVRLSRTVHVDGTTVKLYEDGSVSIRRGDADSFVVKPDEVEAIEQLRE